MTAPDLTDVEAVLHERFGFRELRPGQAAVLGSVLSGRDALAVMPTGGGKSLCYQLPAVLRPGITLVVSPLISLMQDQVEALRQRGIAAGAIHSALSLDERRRVFADMSEADHFLLYVAPERLRSPRFADWFRKAPIGLVAIDEAHCISQWGHDFRPDYRELRQLRDWRPDTPMLGLTATATPQVLDDIEVQMGLSGADRHIWGFYRPNLYYQVEWCHNDEEKLAWLEAAIDQFPDGRIIVYCGTRKQTEELSAHLSRKGHRCGYYHAGLAPEIRDRTQQRFGDGELRILAATNAFGMGIDHPDIRLVIHMQMPANIESLYQEMGRAGRDGDDSTCLLLYARKDRRLQEWFIQQSDAEADVAEARRRALDLLVQYAEGGECRHAGILTYFRDQQRIDACGHCDACDLESPRRVTMDQPPKRSLSKRARVRKAKKLTLDVDKGKALTGDALELQRHLKQWRKDFAAEQELPAFAIFSNRTLRELAERQPTTLEELEQIYGIGPQKLEWFGDTLLREIRKARS
ncbi:MAG: ATP-dependent DNA helicase RecQ [Candidatus Dadabacteria bacterium]|nr:MAG: ATP-dependent DNA helicase RecQ [Candidatus Dadabacteria bacterium]